MIQIELKTDDGTLYNVLLPAPRAEDNLAPEAALEGAVEFVKQTIAQGQAFLNPNEALYIGAMAKVRHIKARYMDSTQVEEAQENGARANNSVHAFLGPVPFDEKIYYLGHEIRVEGLRYGYLEEPDQAINSTNPLLFVYVPLKIDEAPFLEALSATAVSGVVSTVAGKQGAHFETVQHLPLLADITYDQAVEYVEDFLGELRKEQEETRELPPGRKTAKAFKEWKGLP